MTFAVRRLSRRFAMWQVPLGLGLCALAVAVCGIRPMLVLFGYLALVSAELCRVDLREHRLPNALTGPGYLVAALCLVWVWLADAAVPVLELACGGGYLLFLLLMHLGGGMGLGDVKLAGLLGVALGSLGVSAALAGVLVAFVAGGVAGIAALLMPGTARRIPFGPFMLFGFWAAAATAEVYT